MNLPRGRPTIPPHERLTERIEVRATEADRVELEKAAEIAELSLSDWIRDRLQAAAKRELRRAKQ